MLDRVSALISIHALREESDRGQELHRHGEDISIHALREESDQTSGGLASEQTISIHALREESDQGNAEGERRERISIHALREESDHSMRRSRSLVLPFQSTLSVRRATRDYDPVIHLGYDFNPRSP